MKVCKHLFLAVGLFFLFSISLSAQKLDFVHQDSIALSDSTSFTIDLPALVGKTKADTTPPFYRHLFIFGDGNFLFSESTGSAKLSYRYGKTPVENVDNYFARAYSAGAYSTNDEPPLVAAGPIGVPSAGSITQKTVVDANRYLKILRNVQVKPGAPFVSIIALKNPSDTTILNGQLYFFYNGRLRTISKKTVTKQPEYSKFKIRENLFYQDSEESVTFHYTTQGSVNSEFENMLLMEISGLDPQEEFHFFIDMEGDASMMEVFEATEKAEMDFAAAFGTIIDSSPVLTPDSLQQSLNNLELLDFLNDLTTGQTQVPPITPDSVQSFLQNLNTSQNNGEIFSPFSQTGNIVDYYVSTASLVKSHDPNFMLMEACACPAQSDRYQIFTTVQCENIGFGETDNIFIDIKLPDGVKAKDVVVDPVGYHPSNGPSDQISMIKLSDDSIRWELLNFGIEGTPLHGVGDPRTFANVQFHMYSSVEPALLGSIYACIRFDTLTNAPVCTVPVAVSLIAPDAQEGQVLTCVVGECADDPSNHSWPWWLWLLLILLIILIIWLIRRS